MPFISPCSNHLLVTASIFHAFAIPCIHFRELPWYKSDNWSLSVALHWSYNDRYQNKVLLDGKTIFCGNGYTSLFLKHSFFLRVQGWKVSMFPYLCFKYWETRGILLTYWNDYPKLCTKIIENNTKIHVHFLVKRPFSLSHFSTSRDMYLLVIVQKNKQKKKT